ncbi:C40 family peptidase [Pedobacter sp. GR22-6]|uniref:C40 family peptidase n=1 Tax=Pedobacter sp. GR22-6 TaxID=3127957 RepID=UPI00307D7512
MEAQYAICKVPVAPLRAEPSDKAEISTQLLFGEPIEVLQKTEKWWQVRNAGDGYEGWVDFKQLAPVNHEVYLRAQQDLYLVPAGYGTTVTDQNGHPYLLSPGTPLPFYKDGFCQIGEEMFKVNFEPLQVSATMQKDIIGMAQFFQNTAYLWGGKNLFGMDCSGFTQIVFKLNGISLKRDAWQQAEQGETVDFLQEVQPGDVAFFDNEEGRITHVGIMLNSTEIIHASGKVRIDKLDSQGIYNADLGKYTHKLRIIKRYT